jgi:ribA/ribD-fused uncharacterized protein
VEKPPRFTVGPDAITSFKNTFLSNMQGGVERLYQAEKPANAAQREAILATTDPYAAKRLGGSCDARHDWETVKLEIMRRLVAAKFAPGSEFAAKLLATGTVELVEGNTWRDQCWGAVWDGSAWVGHNHLGKILMQIRDELRPRLRISGHAVKLGGWNAPAYIDGWYRTRECGDIELAEGVLFATTGEDWFIVQRDNVIFGLVGQRGAWAVMIVDELRARYQSPQLKHWSAK